MCGYFCIGFIDFMLAGKKLTDFTSLFSPHDFKKMMIQFWVILKMNEIRKTDQTKFRLNKISKIEIILTQKLIKENCAVKNWANMLMLSII